MIRLFVYKMARRAAGDAADSAEVVPPRHQDSTRSTIFIFLQAANYWDNIWSETCLVHGS